MSTNGTPETMRFRIELELTPAEQMHIFAQWMQAHPNTDLESLTKRQWRDAILETLYVAAVKPVQVLLPNDVEIKKMDYKAQLKGTAPPY
jgi:hypothetical protein